MIKTIVVDDEKDARFLLRSTLEKNYGGFIDVVAEADNAETAVKTIETYKPELVFLDIKMPDGTGFDVLSKIKDPSFEVIFVTAYDQYAIKAFQFSAFGYLLKPIKNADLKSLLDKLSAKINHSKNHGDPRMKILIENYGDDSKIKKLVISNMEGFQVLNIEDIIRLEGDRNYTHFFFAKDKKVTTSKTIGEYEELLDDYGFFRIHQSHIINLRHVKAFRKATEEVEMLDGKLLKLSRYRKAEFISRFI